MIPALVPAASGGPGGAGVWAASRAAVLLLSLFERYATGAGRSSSWLGLWQHWDWYRYLTVAEYGYTSGKGPAYDENLTAFLPGYPAVPRAVHLAVPDWAGSGLLVSLVAGAVAVVALARLTEFEYVRRRPEGSAADAHRAARYAVLLLVCAPAAVFLAAGYTESLFLAFAVPGWLAARRGRWVRAGVLLAAACTIRINGLFVLAGVAVMFLTSRPARRDWTRAPALPLPLAAAGAYAAYLKDITGDWLEWLHAEKRGWSRSPTNPITAWRTSWHNAFGAHVDPARDAAVVAAVGRRRRLARRPPPGPDHHGLRGERRRHGRHRPALPRRPVGRVRPSGSVTAGRGLSRPGCRARRRPPRAGRGVPRCARG